jgi:hypothetical protein
MTIEQLGIMALGAAIRALIEELHASGHVDRERVVERLLCFKRADGTPILEIEQMAASIRTADFAEPVRKPPTFGVIEGGKAGCDAAGG